MELFLHIIQWVVWPLICFILGAVAHHLDLKLTNKLK